MEKNEAKDLEKGKLFSTAIIDSLDLSEHMKASITKCPNKDYLFVSTNGRKINGKCESWDLFEVGNKFGFDTPRDRIYIQKQLQMGLLVPTKILTEEDLRNSQHYPRIPYNYYEIIEIFPKPLGSKELTLERDDYESDHSFVCGGEFRKPLDKYSNKTTRYLDFDNLKEEDEEFRFLREDILQYIIESGPVRLLSFDELEKGVKKYFA